MEQVERCELDAIEGPSLGRLQSQTMLQRALADMLSIDAENGALLATVAAAMQSQGAMADDCRAAWRSCALSLMKYSMIVPVTVICGRLSRSI